MLDKTIVFFFYGIINVTEIDNTEYSLFSAARTCADFPRFILAKTKTKRRKT